MGVIMKNCVIEVKKVDLDKLCREFTQYSLRKYFDENYQKFIVSIETYDRGSHCCYFSHFGFEDSDRVLFTYSGNEKFTDFFVRHRVPFSFSETENPSLNNDGLLPSIY